MVQEAVEMLYKRKFHVFVESRDSRTSVLNFDFVENLIRFSKDTLQIPSMSSFVPLKDTTLDAKGPSEILRIAVDGHQVIQAIVFKR